jgi:TRAP-type C4-dicarboxylate transport system substrate-binding protein
MNMRRIFLLALVGLFLIPVPTLQAAQVIKIATLSPDGTSWMRAMRAAGDTIAKRSQGRVELRFYPGGVMGNDQSVMRKIRAGQLQGGAVTIGALSGVDKDIEIYGLPFLFHDLREVDQVRSRMDATLRCKSLRIKASSGLALRRAALPTLCPIDRSRPSTISRPARSGHQRATLLASPASRP